MNTVRSSLVLLVIFSTANSLSADQFSYGGDNKKPQAHHNERFTGDKCRVLVHGNSSVVGSYDEPTGELKIIVDRYSHLTVGGRARKVVVMFVDLNCSVDLTELNVGEGGVEIHSVNRRSGVSIGHCDGSVTVKSVDVGSTITVPLGLKSAAVTDSSIIQNCSLSGSQASFPFRRQNHVVHRSTACRFCKWKPHWRCSVNATVRRLKYTPRQLLILPDEFSC